jgi:hypothetical protein
MGRKTLGIFGKGRLIDKFCDYLADSHLPPESEAFLSCVDEVCFYNYGYKNEETFRKSKYFPKIYQKFKSLNVDVSVEPDFETFMASEVVVDASMPSIPPTLDKLADNLFRIHQPKYEGRRMHPWNKEEFDLIKKESARVLNDFWSKKEKNYGVDYRSYSSGASEGRVIFSPEDYNRDWNQSLETLRIVAGIDINYHLGLRCLKLLPFAVPMLLKRGEQIKKIVEQGKPLPVYLNLVNEPCVSSTLLAAVCPEIIPKLVAVASCDLDRIETVLNQKYNDIKSKEGLDKIQLAVSMTGFHDNDLNVPIIYPEMKVDEASFVKLFSKLDFATVYHFLIGEVNRNVINYVKGIGDINTEVSRSLLSAVVNSCKSIDKAYSVYPSINNRPLYNGYFQQINEKQGLFMIGPHRFRNGNVFPLVVRI